MENFGKHLKYENGASMPKLLDRIEYKVDGNGCWIVTSHKARAAGYPRFKHRGKLESGHRIVYEEENGPIPEGILVRHICDNRECINPDHLLLGTYKDNFEDMRERKGIEHLGGYTPPVHKGEDNIFCKLTEPTVKEIKTLLREKKYTHAKIAKIFGVSRSTISDINQGRSWSWLE